MTTSCLLQIAAALEGLDSSTTEGSDQIAILDGFPRQQNTRSDAIFLKCRGGDSRTRIRESESFQTFATKAKAIGNIPQM
jgi:hypothetical protein